MSINCKIDLSESIRRGIDSTDRMGIEIDPAELSPAQREVLANHVMGGNFKSPITHLWPLLPDPTTAGLKEALTKLAGEQVTETQESPSLEPSHKGSRQRDLNVH